MIKIVFKVVRVLVMIVMRLAVEINATMLDPLVSL